MLNTIQQQVYDQVMGGQPITFITGSAGVGKSYLAGKIINQFNDVTLVASTHKAKAVLAQMSGKSASTIHSYLGYALVAKNYTHTLVGGNKKHAKTDLVVLDEISMCPQRLFSHILSLVDNGTIKQLIILGDPVQLKAVSNPPDLSVLDPYRVELIQQMRQAKNDPKLVNYFRSLRKAVEKTKMPSLAADLDNITFVSDHRDFCKLYNECNTNKKIIAYRNSVVDKYNSHIHGTDVFNVGDDITIDKPLGMSKNQDLVKIHSVNQDDEKYTLIVKDSHGQAYKIYHYKVIHVINDRLEALKKAGKEEEYWKLHNVCFRLKHEYAATVHKCQGESYGTVFLDGDDLTSAYQAKKSKWNNPISLDTFLRLYYVALSRMKEHTYIYTGANGKGRFYDKLKRKVPKVHKN